jgi:hypothetical protein
MAAINFPDSPATNDLFTYNSFTYRWDGVKWKAVNNVNNVLPSQTDNSGKFFKTDGTDPSWESITYADITGTVPTWNQNTTGNAATATTATTSGAIANSGGWAITPSGTNLLFAYNGVNKGKLDSSGNFTVTGNVTAYGTV